MSGGFFRGTSADQDTRFSNKQAKLLKSQKFPPELDHLVDITKVKMDVVRPWIANRVTELLGFEDEVLINFIYGLLDGTNVNGKQVQISLTGFMEKNTGKFMKELWTLLLSAQKNASGVPQQFLDAKEEETKRKKLEADRIASEIQKKKEKESKEHEQEKMRRMDGVVDISKAIDADLESISKNTQRRTSTAGPKEEKEMDERNGLRGRTRVSKSPRAADHSPRTSKSPRAADRSPRGTPSRSISKSFSNSRSYSNERHKSRSVSGSPQPRGRSVSSQRAHRSPQRRSVTPRRRHSPRGSLSPRRRSSHSRRISRSPPRRRSPSPVRRRLRSPFRRRSPSPVRRRLPSPVRRRSPSPSRRRMRSPVRRRSPSPLRRRSPSPLRRRSRSPVRRQSPMAVRRRHRSPSTPRRRSPSPLLRRSPVSSRRRSPTPSRRPYGLSSPSPVRRKSPSSIRRKSPVHHRRSPVQSPRGRIRSPERLSPVRRAPLKESVEELVDTRKGPKSVARRPQSFLRSPQRDSMNRNTSRNRVPSLSPSPEKSPIYSESPPGIRESGARDDKKLLSPHESPVRQARERMTRGRSRSPEKSRERKPRRESPEIIGGREDGAHKPYSVQKDSPMNAHRKEEYSPERSAGRRASETRSRLDNFELRRKDHEIMSERTSGRVVHPEVTDQRKSPTSYTHSTLGEKPRGSDLIEGNRADENSPANNIKDSVRHHKSESVPKSVEKVDQNNQSGNFDSGSEDSDKYRANVKEKRKHKRSDRHEMASDDDHSYDSEVAERKEAKRRRREEKKLRKEERHRRHEERRRRREERHAEKLKVRSTSAVTRDKNHDDALASDDEHVARQESSFSDTEERESKQKKLEIELRQKALETYQAKKGISR